ncbi:hypothetical protein POF45_17050 [Pseudomonas sp. 681]|uniref:Chemotaxis protein n=1 Tax=Pseudomonas fungipugnans TaxID=3024217 RepID=A0ABT6QQE9_9PSED|nr:hypothetical protein [Pseudomonas sp. 681]MDI2593122.1 hypothetical protein [Pseudomonas sp. 681]
MKADDNAKADEQPTPDPADTAASLLEALNEHLLKQAAEGAGPEALNQRIVESVNLLNTQLAAHVPVLSALGPELLIAQARGLVAQSAASYFDGATKLALASQGVLLRQMTESIVNNNLDAATESALGALNTHLLVGGAAAVAAASGVLDAEGVSQALERINTSIAQFSAIASERTPSA